MFMPRDASKSVRPWAVLNRSQVEVAARRDPYLTTRTRLAHLPIQRTLEQFDFAFQPSID